MLSASNSKVLEAIKGYYEVHGFSPSFREIAQLCNFKSINTVSCHLKILKKKGYINTQDKQPRTIQILM
jgi:repressor LexA